MAMIIALSTSANVFAQERGLKIYFSANNGETTVPQILVTDDNNSYNLPANLTVAHQGIVWANKARYWEMFEQDVTDRVIADYLNKNSQKGAGLKLTFGNFPYEVNMIQWNVMNDLLSSSILNLLDNYRITTTCRQYDGTGWQYTDEHWDMNFFKKRVTFGAKEVPWIEGEVLNGLSSFEIVERSWKKSPLGILINHETDLDEQCRTFIKAGWNGVTGSGSNITDEDDDNWAFKVKFTLPDIRMRSYAYDKATGAIGQQDNIIYQGEKKVHALQGYISAHAGAVEPTYDPTDQSDFHFEYFADASQMSIQRYSGVILDAKVAGDIPVTVVLMRGPDREVCRYTQTISVSEKLELSQKAEICIGFVDGKKGYDLTLTEKNAQIKGFITNPAKDKNGQNVDLSITENASLCHFEYSESSNGEIITIDPLTGAITPKKEGDVQITVILKDGNNIYSDPFTYTLHVFGKYEGVNVTKHEGLESTNELLYHFYYDRNVVSWPASQYYDSSYESFDWQPTTYLRTSTSIQENSTNQSGAGVDGWKEFVRYKSTSANYWRAIAQKICFDLKIPKYSIMDVRYSFAGNLNVGTAKGTNIQFGFEVLDLGNVKNTEVTTSNKKFNDITWNTKNTGEGVRSASYTSLAQKAIESNGGYVGDGCNSINWSYNDSVKSDFGTSRYYTHYVAVMAYLYGNGGYPGDFSVGYKGIPTYKYYTKITYAKNDGTGTIVRAASNWITTTSKTATTKLLKNKTTVEENMLKRDGYTFIGWSTDPNATTAEYEFQDDFLIYDNVNGGGKGPVTLYAVWQPNAYAVELRKVEATATGGTDYVVATYTKPMPEGANITAPTNVGKDFNGYYRMSGSNMVYYYDKDMKSTHVWDRIVDTDCYVYAYWTAHKTRVILDPRGGNNYGATEITATYGQPMPTEGVNLSAPKRAGYTFAGYYYEGNGGKYYNADMTSARSWYIDERTLNPQVEYITLYAKWIPNTYIVTLDPQGGSGGTTSVTATYEQPLPSGLTAPTKPGYEFRGYYSIENDEWAESQGNDNYYGGKQYYDKDMNGVEPWGKTEGGTIYAHWAPKTYIVTLDAAGGVLPNPVVDDNIENFNITKVSNSVMTLSIVYKTGKTHDLVHSTAKKPGYELLGWYDSLGVKVISVDEKSRNCTITDNGGYWTADGTKYNYPKNLTLTAHYRQKYQTPEDYVIAFDNEKVEDGEDWLWAVVNDLVGSAQEVYQKTGKETMVFDLRQSTNMWTGHQFDCQKVMDELHKPEYSAFISPNVIVHFNTKSYNYEIGKSYNAVTADNKCQDLRVTDRHSIKIIEAFDAQKASYARDAGISDKETEQAQYSVWGTLCLPYPVKNKTNGVKYYWLQSTANDYMEFEEYGEDAVIPANTPVLYKRTEGVSSMITIEETNRYVPMNKTFQAVTINYADLSNLAEGTYPLASADESIQNWEFRGNLKTSVFCGRGYVNPPADATIFATGEVYYFKQNKFTHLLSKRVIDGKTYAAGKMNLYPYRAYFYQKKGSGAKISAYSILVSDEDGTLDITDMVFGDGEGDGKIYDLNGIRVMQPVKGRLYIVNGKKKIYR